ALPGFADLHPLQHEDTIQGMLELLYGMQEYLTEISGLPAVSLQPAAGAHGELTALFVAAAYFRDTNQPHRKKVLVPDNAHGTNPASAALAGFDAVTVKGGPDGLVDLDDLRPKLGPATAALMTTNPNTLGPSATSSPPTSRPPSSPKTATATASTPTARSRSVASARSSATSASSSAATPTSAPSAPTASAGAPRTPSSTPTTSAPVSVRDST